VITEEDRHPKKPHPPVTKKPRSSPVLPPRTSGNRTLTPRRPQAGREISSSTLHPHVAATDRLRFWSTPYSLAFENRVSNTLPPSSVDSVFETIHAAYAPATKGTYSAGLLRFTQFCDENLIPEADRMPASFLLLVAFISSHKGRVSGCTIKTWLSGLKAWHDVSHAPWCGDDRWVQMARVTANKLGTAFHKKQRSPATTRHLLALCKYLDISTPSHAATWAIACGAFWGCRRLGELMVNTLTSLDPAFHPPRSTPVSYKSFADGSSFASIHLPWTKTTRELGGTFILTGRSDDLCPIKALNNHLMVNSLVPGNTLLTHSPPSSQLTLTL
jgi:hypothetical protein